MNYTELLIAREKELGRPVRVGLAGAGQMGSGLAAPLACLSLLQGFLSLLALLRSHDQPMSC